MTDQLQSPPVGGLLRSLLDRRIVQRTTQPSDAADRYFCERSKRTLWVEPENTKHRSTSDAPRYLVDDGDGSRTFYKGESLSDALHQFTTFSKYTRKIVSPQASPLRLTVDVRSAGSDSR